MSVLHVQIDWVYLNLLINKEVRLSVSRYLRALSCFVLLLSGKLAEMEWNGRFYKH